MEKSQINTEGNFSKIIIKMINLSYYNNQINFALISVRIFSSPFTPDRPGHEADHSPPTSGGPTPSCLCGTGTTLPLPSVFITVS
jgi:hypothetical protein